MVLTKGKLKGYIEDAEESLSDDVNSIENSRKVAKKSKHQTDPELHLCL